MIKNIVYVVQIWWERDDHTTDSVFIDKDKAMQRAKEILNTKKPYAVWISTAQLNKPEGVKLFYTEKWLPCLKQKCYKHSYISRGTL